MNKELIGILKCISETPYINKSPLCALMYGALPSPCELIHCCTCIINIPENNSYKPYLIKL